jgi:hypothetical protein
MSNSSGGIAVGVLALGLFVLYSDFKPHPTQTITADSLVCANPLGGNILSGKCTGTKTQGGYTITVTPGANTCAVLNGSVGDIGLSPRPGKLTYIDEANWECQVAEANNLMSIFQLTGGDLYVRLTDLDKAVPDEAEVVDRSDTLMGKWRHFLRAMRNSK